MIYVQARFYIIRFLTRNALWCIPKKYKAYFILYGMGVLVKTLKWKIENGHKN